MKFAIESLGPKQAGLLRLEEITSETSGRREYWLITLSMMDLDDPSNALAQALNALCP